MVQNHDRCSDKAETILNKLKSIGKDIRSFDTVELKQLFIELAELDTALAVKWMFYVCDIRNGLGEREVFKMLFQTLLTDVDRNTAVSVIKYIPLFGRWDMIVELCIECENSHAALEAQRIVKCQLRKDITRMESQGPISMLAKWMPSSNTSNKIVREKAYKMRQILGEMKESDYRKMLSGMRSHIEEINNHTSIDEDTWDMLNTNDFILIGDRKKKEIKKQNLQSEDLNKMYEVLDQTVSNSNC